MAAWKARFKELIPDSVLRLRRQYLARKNENELQRYASAKEAFTRVYEAGYWGRSGEPGEKYYSGDGSHMGSSVAPYVSAACGFLQSFEEKPDVVDLGCGDFNVGSRIRPNCGKYIGVDVVEGLVKRNIEKYANENVDFRAIDITNEDLPKGDVVFIRQVLQHLSNSEIEKVVAKLPWNYRFIVLTEHLPVESFVPNLDKPRGFQVRLQGEKAASGIVLTESPFNLKVTGTTTLCEAFETLGDRKGVIRTILYEL